jgi:predicted aspartyl protease
MTLKLHKPKGISDLGLTRIAVKIRNFGLEDSYTSNFLVDTGAMDVMAPSSELRRLGIKPVGSHFYEMASGELIKYEYGLAELSFLDEVIATQVLFGPEEIEPILGAIALESAGFVVDPVAERIKKLPTRSLKALTLKSVA